MLLREENQGESLFVKKRGLGIASIAVAVMMVTVSFGSVVAQGDLILRISDEAEFFEDFENGILDNDWGKFVDPPDNIFDVHYVQTIGGPFDVPSEYRLYMLSQQPCTGGEDGVAYGITPSFSLDYLSDYMIYIDFAVLRPDNGQFTVVRDGNIWLIIDDGADLKAYDGAGNSVFIKSLAHPPDMSSVELFTYSIEVRAHPSANNYEVFVNGTSHGAYDFVTSPSPLYYLIMGDELDDCPSYGAALWDNIIVSPLLDPTRTDDFEDLELWHWTTVTTTNDYFWPWDTGTENALKMYFDGPDAYARGYTPFLNFDSSNDYVASFKFMVPYQTNSLFTVIDTKQVKLVITSGSDLAVYYSDEYSEIVKTLVPMIWYTIDIRTDISALNFYLYVEGDDGLPGVIGPTGSYILKAEPQISSTIMFGGDSASGGYGHGEAYWDDIVVDIDSDGDGLSDWEEDEVYGTEPDNPDTDNDGLNDGLEVGIAPYDSDPVSSTDPLDDDTDDDGLLDGTEDMDKDGFRDGNNPTDSDSDWNDPVDPGETDPNIADTDGDKLTDGLEVGLVSPEGVDTASPPWDTKSPIGYGPDDDPDTITDPVDIDTDDDGLPDGEVDLDDDGQIELLEFEDRNFNGLRDGNDVLDSDSDWNGGAGLGETDPTTIDTDFDDISEYDEIVGTTGYLTDPLAYDTDGDYLGDGLEQGLSISDYDPPSTTDPLDRDSDDDGIYDGTEDRNSDGVVSPKETDPNLRDTDEDELTDGQEIGLAYPEGYSSYAEWQADGDSHTASGPDGFAPDADEGDTKTNPLEVDTDGDDLPDGWIDGWLGSGEPGVKDCGEFEDRDLDGEVDEGTWEYCGGDGETDPNDVDTDTDLRSDYDEIIVEPDTNPTNPLIGDTDGDGIPDGWEVEHNLDPNFDDADFHYDSDGVSNYEEYGLNTDPFKADTDGDFLPDGPPISSSRDVNPTMYSVNPTKMHDWGDSILDDMDILVVEEGVSSKGRIFDVSVAINYDTPSSDQPVVASSSIEDGNLNSVIGKFSISTPYEFGYTAVVKVKYQEADLPSGVNEINLLMYYYIGDVEGSPYWTIFKHTELGEDTWRDDDNNYVWAKMKRFHHIAIADSTENNLDLEKDQDEGHDYSDGEELNVAEYDPIYNEFCDVADEDFCVEGSDHWQDTWSLEFQQAGETTLYAKMEVVKGAIEIADDDSDFNVEGEHVTSSNYAIGQTSHNWDRPVKPWGEDAYQYKLGQKFKNTVSSGCLGKVMVKLYRADESGGSGLLLSIYTDDTTRSPSIPGSQVSWVQKTWSELPTSSIWVEFEFSYGRLCLTPDAYYWIVVENWNREDKFKIFWPQYDQSSMYAEGYLAVFEKDIWGNWNWAWTSCDWPSNCYDMTFRIYENSFPYNPKIRVEGGHGGSDWDWEYGEEYFSDNHKHDVDWDFIKDINLLLMNHQGKDDYVFMPIVFRSESLGELYVFSIEYVTIAIEFDDEDLLEDDFDGDGLADIIENAYDYTYFDVYDSDGDDLSDGEEVLIYGTDPGTEDSDGDSLTDYEEVIEYHTDPWLEDTDGDGVWDDVDKDPLVDLHIIVRIKEIQQLDDLDIFDAGDFYLKIYVNSELWETDQPGEGHNKPHEFPQITMSRDIPDDSQLVFIEIQLWDDDFDCPGGLDCGDDLLDISKNGLTLDLVFDTETGRWDTDDYIGDINGYRHASGDEDGTEGKSSDYDDCEIWFDITLNDLDGDGLTHWEEVRTYGIDPTKHDTDNDGIWDREAEYQPSLNPLVPDNPGGDIDGDTLSNADEVNVWRTDPTNIDTDGDNIRDDRDKQKTQYNRRFAFIFEVAASHDPPLDAVEGLDVANSLGLINFDHVYLVSDNIYDTPTTPLNFIGTYVYYVSIDLPLTFDDEAKNFISATIETADNKDGKDSIIVYMTSHGGMDFGPYEFILGWGITSVSESRIRFDLAPIGDALDLLWISTCWSAHSFDQWGPNSGLIVIGNSYLNDAGSVKWMAAYNGGLVSGVWVVGFSNGNSVENAFIVANNVETGHDLAMEDNYADLLYLV